MTDSYATVSVTSPPLPIKKAQDEAPARKTSPGRMLVARKEKAGQIAVADSGRSNQLVPYSGPAGGHLAIRPEPVKGEVVPYEKKQYLPAVVPRLGDLDAYIRYANAAPILSPEEEHALAVRLRDEGDERPRRGEGRRACAWSFPSLADF